MAEYNKLTMTKICGKCKIEKSLTEFTETPSDISRIYSWSCNNCKNEIVRLNAQSAKVRVINYYSNGTNQCKCCGEKFLDFLTLDHIEGGGGKKVYQRGSTFYYWLIKNKYPDVGLQVLCYNCNCGKRTANLCPHEKYNIPLSNNVIPLLDL